jgi:hypothetical protein
MVLGVGVLVLDKFGRSTRTSITVVSTGQNLSAASSVDFSETYCTEITSVSNATNSYDTSLLTFSNADGCAITNAGITGCGPGAGAFCNITYKYGASTTSQTALDNVNTAVSGIASNWLPLIVTVMILAIILSLVMGAFGGVKRE